MPKPHKLLLAFTVLALVVIMVSSRRAKAQGIQCGNREQMVKTLDKRFREHRFAMGLSSSVSLLEIFVSKKGTWTIITTRANGRTCIVAAGKSWTNMPVEPDGKGT